MKATGIVRRIDDLGRVVIPKEIRRTLRIKEGDPLEIFVEEDKLIFQRYNPIDIEKWETAKNILRHLLTKDFILENSNHKEMACYGKHYAVYESRADILDDGYTIGYIYAPGGEYTADELSAASKIAKEILLS